MDNSPAIPASTDAEVLVALAAEAAAEAVIATRSQRQPGDSRVIAARHTAAVLAARHTAVAILASILSMDGATAALVLDRALEAAHA